MKVSKDLLFKDSIAIGLYFALLAFIAIFFAYERIINSDAAFYLFKLIHFENFNIEHGRYSAFISQLFVLPFIKMGANLKLIIFIYSFSFVLLFFIVFLIIDRLLKDRSSAFTLIFLLVAGLAHPHYRPVSESTQGLVYALLLPGILHMNVFFVNKYLSNIIKLLLGLLIVVLCYFSHPITIFPLGFIIIYYMINTKFELKKPWFWLLILGLVLLYSSKFFLGSGSAYEENKLVNLNSFFSIIPEFFNIYSTRFFLKRITSTYLITTVLFLTTFIYYLRSGSYYKLLLISLFCMIFFFIHNTIYQDGGSDLELEKNFMTLNFFIFFSFFHDVFPNLRLNVLRTGFLVGVLLFSAWIIKQPAHIYRERIDYYEKLNEELQSQKGRKIIAFIPKKIHAE